VCVSLLRAVTVIAEDMIATCESRRIAKNLRTFGNRSRSWKDGSLEIQLRNTNYIHSLARAPSLIPSVVIILMLSRGKYTSSVVGQI